MDQLLDTLTISPGKYWFYGYSQHGKRDQERCFNQFLSKLCLLVNIPDSERNKFTYGTGNSVEAGLFYFEYEKNPGESTSLHWASYGLERSIMDNKDDIKKRYNRIKWENLTERKLIQIENKCLESGLFIPLGKTQCSDNCIFFDYCDRVPNSILNPSTRILDGVSCETHNFSIIELCQK